MRKYFEIDDEGCIKREDIKDFVEWCWNLLDFGVYDNLDDVKEDPGYRRLVAPPTIFYDNLPEEVGGEASITFPEVTFPDEERIPVVVIAHEIRHRWQFETRRWDPWKKIGDGKSRAGWSEIEADAFAVIVARYWGFIETLTDSHRQEMVDKIYIFWQHCGTYERGFSRELFINYDEDIDPVEDLRQSWAKEEYWEERKVVEERQDIFEDLVQGQILRFPWVEPYNCGSDEEKTH